MGDYRNQSIFCDIKGVSSPVGHATIDTREAVKPGLDWILDWTGFWTRLYYVIGPGQCKHGVTVHV